MHGLDSAQIAQRVFLSPSTVDWHLWNVYEKLSVDGRSGLYARFFREMAMPDVEHGDELAASQATLNVDAR